MTHIQRLTLVAALGGSMLLGTAGTASAHFLSNAPAGTCRFLGGPGNPGHPGHAHGHMVALAAERSDAVSIGSC